MSAPCVAVQGAPLTRAPKAAVRGACRPRPAAQRLARPARAAADTERGASGLDIAGSRPTSPKAWEAQATTLKSKGVKFVAPQEVASAQARGVPVIDIRPKEDYEKGHVPGSTNVQLYQLIAGWSARQIWRRAGFAFFGVLNGTEVNPDFMQQIEVAAPKKGAGVILVCNIGGSLEPTGPSKFGRQSRSLLAAYELVQAGYTNVQVLKGGMGEWLSSERPVEKDEE